MDSIDKVKAKKYFSMYLKSMRKIQRYRILLDELEQIRQSSYVPTTVCDAWILCGQLLDIHQIQLEREIQECERVCGCIADTVRRLEGEEREVLTLRYIEMHTWDEIAEKIGYSVMHVHRIHNCAIEKSCTLLVTG